MQVPADIQVIQALQAFRAAVVLDVLAKIDQGPDDSQLKRQALAEAPELSMSTLTSLPSSEESGVLESKVVEHGPEVGLVLRKGTRDRRMATVFIGNN